MMVRLQLPWCSDPDLVILLNCYHDVLFNG